MTAEEELTAQIIEAIGPIVDGKSTALVIDCFAAAAATVLAQGGVGAPDAHLILCRYAERIMDFAELIRTTGEV